MHKFFEHDITLLSRLIKKDLSKWRISMMRIKNKDNFNLFWKQVYLLIASFLTGNVWAKSRLVVMKILTLIQPYVLEIILKIFF